MRDASIDNRRLQPSLRLDRILRCGGGKSGETGGVPDEDDDQGYPIQTAEEKKYAEFARGFVEALAHKKYAEAHTFTSSHLRKRVDATQFAEQCAADSEPYGLVKRVIPNFGVACSPDDLTRKQMAGESQRDYQLRLIGVSMTLGDLPEDVLEDDLRASISVECKIDPMTIPLDAGQEPYSPEDDTVCYLTVIVVQDGNELKIGHYFWRWPSMLD